MSQPYKSGRQQNLNLGITSVTESKTVLQTIGKVGIGTTNAQNHSLFVVGSTNITGDINVGGASTFVGVGTFNNNLYVANQLYVGGVNVSGGASIGQDITTRNFLASGISTFNGIADFNNDIDVDGHTELDNVNVSGIITATSLDVLTNFDVYDTQAVFHNNVRIDGNLSIGGTATVITAQDLRVFDKEITLGITTDAFGNDISNDTTANHGGIAIASTEGSPLVDFTLAGFSTIPKTYKQLMWVGANSYGVGTTDAWMFNYAVGVGSTLVPNGVRFAVKEIQFTDDTINTPNINVSKNLNVSGLSTLGIATASQLYVAGVSTFVGVGTFQNDLYIDKNLYIKNDLTARNLNITGLTTVGVVSARSINATGIITANSFRPSSGFIQAADGTNSFFIYSGSGNVAFQGTIGASQINNAQGYQAITFATTPQPTVTFIENGIFNGVVTARQFVGDISVGVATITTGNITNANGSTLNYTGLSTITDISAAGIRVSGVVTARQFDGDVNSGVATITQGNITNVTGTNLNYTGISTLGIATATTLSVAGVTTTGSLTVNGTSLFTGGIQANSIIFANGGVQGNLTGNVTSTGSNTFGSISVTGISTLASLGGITTTGGDLYVGGDLYIKDDLFFDELTARNANVTGITTLGFTTAAQLYVKGLEVAGVATFRGNAYFGDTDVLHFGDGNDLQVFHDGSNSYLRETGVGSLILASDGVGVDIYNVSQGEYQARFANNGAVELYYDSIKRLETTGYGITVYNTIQAPQINISGIGTIDGVTISSGIVTSSQPGVTTVKYYGDGSNLFGVNAFNVVNQVLTASPVFPTFANNIGVTSIGIADTEMGFIPTSGNLGIGSTNPTAKLQVVGNVVISGFTTLGTGATTTATLFTNQLSVAGVSTFIGVTTHRSTVFGNQLSISGFSTLSTLHAPKLTYNGSDFGASGYFPKADGSGGWSWADVPGLFSVNNILNGFNVSDEGLIVGTAGSITQLDFRGNNIVATADPQPNGIATIRVSDTPSFLNLTVTPGISTLGVTTSTSLFSNQLSVSGLSTFVGVGTFNSDLYVGGNLYIQNDLVFDEATVRNINVTGISTLGIARATTLNVSGVTTSALLNVGVGGTILTTTNGPRVGINSVSPAYTLDVNGDINFNGLLYQNNSLFIASRWSSGSGDDIYRLNGDVGIGTTNPLYTLEVVGDARVSGLTSVTNLRIGGTVSAGTTTGTNGQYLKSTGIGVTWVDFPILRTTGITTATEGQSTFAFSYNVGFVDVYVNGVKLTGSEFTATNGSSVVLSSPAFESDIVEFIGYNTVSTSGGSGSISSLNDLTDVTLTSPATGEALVYDGTQWVNDYTVTASTSTTSQTVIHTLSSATYRSIEYTIQATQGLKYHLTKLLVVHDGLVAYNTEYGTVFTIDSLGTFDVDISGGNIRLLVTPSAVTTTNYKIKFTAFKV